MPRRGVCGGLVRLHVQVHTSYSLPDCEPVNLVPRDLPAISAVNSIVLDQLPLKQVSMFSIASCAVVVDLLFSSEKHTSLRDLGLPHFEREALIRAAHVLSDAIAS